MAEKEIEEIRKLYEKGEYFKAIEFIKSIPESSMKKEIELWAFIFMPMSTGYHDFKLGSNIEKKLNNIPTGMSYLSLLAQLANARLLIDVIGNIFEKEKFSKLENVLDSIEQLYTKLYSEATLPDSRFLLDEAYLGYLVFKARIMRYEKKYEEGLQYYFKGLRRAQELHLNLLIYRFYYEISMFYQMKGELNKCIEYTFKRFYLANKINNHYWKIDAPLNLGIIYSLQGNKKESLNYLNQGIANLENFDDIVTSKYNILLLVCLGETQIDFGLFSEGLKNLEQCKNMLECYLKANKIDMEFFSHYYPDILMGMFNYWFYVGDDEHCRVILSEFSNIPTRLNDLNENIYKFCKARYLMKKGRVLDKSTAFVMLKEIINSKFVWYEITFPSLILLTQILIEDYDNTHDSGIILEINSYIENLNRATDSIQIRLNIAILNSKLKALEGKITEAENILVENLKISNESGLCNEKKLIGNELAKLREEKTRWYELVLKNPIDLEKLQLQYFKSYLEEAKTFISYNQIKE